MKPLILIAFFNSLSLFSFSQEIILIKDSIMTSYMKSGYANKNFVPEGPLDARHRRQGKWKDYETGEDGSFQIKEGAPSKATSIYLFYSEGEYLDNSRTGEWKIYVIENKTFRKILSRTLTYQAGIPEGSFTYYYPDGRPAQVGSYKAGAIEGPSTMLYPDGNVFGKQNFVAGKKHGRQDYYYQDGKPIYFYEYKNGLRQGPYEAYYKDGKLQESCHYVADSIDGVYKYFYPNGQIWTETVYKNGRMVSIIGSYDKYGKELDKGTLVNGNGYINYYTEEGKIYSVVTFKDGIIVKEENR